MSSSVQYFFIQKSFPYWFCRKDQMPHGLLNYFQYLQQYLFNVTVHFLSSVSPQSMMKVKSSVQFSRHSKITFSSVQSLSHVRLYGTPRTAALQASLSITNPWSLLKLMPMRLVMPSSIVPFSSCLQSFPASGSFPVSQLFASGGQSIGASASTPVLPMNIQD